MANYNCYYFGPYVKVYPPKKIYTNDLRTCSNIACRLHGKYSSENFCGACGSPVKMSPISHEGHENLHEFLDDVLGDEEMFSVVCIDNKDYQFFISNRGAQGGVRIEDHGEYPMSEDPNFFDRKDWALLIEKLIEKNFKFVKGIGVIAYYN